MKNEVRTEMVEVKQAVVRELGEFMDRLDEVKEKLVHTQDGTLEGIEEVVRTATGGGGDNGEGLGETFMMSPVELRAQMGGVGGIEDPDEGMAERVAELEQILSTIVEGSGVEEAEDLLPILQQSEESNFTHYKDILMLNHEIEELELRKRILKEEMKIISARVLVRTAKSTKKKRSSEREIGAYQDEANRLSEQYSTNMDILSTVSPGLLDIFNSVFSFLCSNFLKDFEHNL